MEPRIGTGYTFSERSEFTPFWRPPKVADLNALSGLYREVERFFNFQTFWSGGGGGGGGGEGGGAY